MADLILRYDLRPRVDTMPVFLESTSGELNPLTLIPSRPFYAFLQSVEEVDSGEFEDERRTPANLPSVTQDMPETLGMDDNDRGDGEAWVVARFEAIDAEYFNANIDNHRNFYRTELGVDIDDLRLERQHWHDATQTLAHRQLNHALLNVPEPWLLPALILTFPNTPENWVYFRGLFPEDHWVGLTLHRAALDFGLPLTACLGDDEDDEESWTLLAIHSVAPTRLNNLLHVISLDFAPDAHIVGTHPELPAPRTLQEVELERRVMEILREARRQNPLLFPNSRKQLDLLKRRKSGNKTAPVNFKRTQNPRSSRKFVVHEFGPGRVRVVKAF